MCLVGGAARHRERGKVRDRTWDVFGWGPVDLVPEDPAAPAEALAGVTLAAEPAGPARGDAGDEKPLPGLDRLHACPDRLDGPDRLVAEDAPVGHRRDVTLEDMKVRAADRYGVHSDDRVGVGDDFRLRYLLPRLCATSVVNERPHGHLLCAGQELDT